MERNGLDDQLKKRLGSQQEPVDLERLWSAIEPELPPEKEERKPVIWWWFASLAIAFVFGLSGDAHKDIRPVHEQVERPIRPSTGQETPSNQLFEDRKQAKKTIEKESVTTSNNQRVASNSTEEDYDPARDSRYFKPFQSISPVSPKKVITNFPQLTITTDPASVNLISPLPLPNVALVSRSQPPFPNMSISRSVPQSRWEVGLHQMIGTPIYHFQPVSQEFQALATQQAESVDPWWALSTSLEVGYKLRSNLRVKSGISVHWTYERFSHSYSKDTMIQKSVTTAYHAEAPNDTTFFNTDQSFRRTTHREITHFNRQSMVQIPLGISYQFTYLRQRLEMEAGALVNLRWNQQGRGFNSSGEIIDLESMQPRNEIDLGWYGQVGMVLRPEQRIQYVLQAHASYIPNFGLQNDILRQDYLLLGGKVGVRYRW